MHNNKETGIYSACFVIVAALSIAALVYFDIDPLFCVTFLVLLVILYIVGMHSLLHCYKRVKMLRERIEYVKENKEIPQKISREYLEGEIGKLEDSVSDLVRMLDEAYNKQLLEKEFLRDIISDISHQIKTPVASLTVYNDIFMAEAIKENRTDKIELLKQSEQQLERITWLVQAILQLARIEAKSIEFKKEQINAVDLLRSAVDIVKNRAELKNQQFVFEGDMDATINVDPEWFKEAIINIVKNAIDYSPEHGRIVLCVTKTPIATKISIKDNGRGIPEKDRLNIFKRFYRVNGNTVNPNSVGIGLALSKSIIEGCGGHIRVESRYIDECIKGEVSYTDMVITM